MENAMVKETTHTGVSPSLEDYLEAIYWISEKKLVARARDIAELLEVTRSAVTMALKQLNAEGLVHYDPYSYATLTDRGKQIAQDVIRRHEVLTSFLQDCLRLPSAKAAQYACAIEHTINDDICARLEEFMQFWAATPQMRHKWLERLKKWEEKTQR